MVEIHKNATVVYDVPDYPTCTETIVDGGARKIAGKDKLLNTEQSFRFDWTRMRNPSLESIGRNREKLVQWRLLGKLRFLDDNLFGRMGQNINDDDVVVLC